MVPLQGLFDLRAVLRTRAKSVPLLCRWGRRVSDGAKRSALRRRPREDAGPLSGCGAAVRSDDLRPHDSRRSRRAVGGTHRSGAGRPALRRLGLSRRSSACGALSGGAERDVRRFSRLRVHRAGRILRCTPCEEDGPPPPEDRVGSAPKSRPTEGGGDRAGRRNRRIIRPDESS